MLITAGAVWSAAFEVALAVAVPGGGAAAVVLHAQQFFALFLNVVVIGPETHVRRGDTVTGPGLEELLHPLDMLAGVADDGEVSQEFEGRALLQHSLNLGIGVRWPMVALRQGVGSLAGLKRLLPPPLRLRRLPKNTGQ